MRHHPCDGPHRPKGNACPPFNRYWLSPGPLGLGCEASAVHSHHHARLDPTDSRMMYGIAWSRLLRPLAIETRRSRWPYSSGGFWSTPSRITSAFPIDRRELADRVDLGLTEAQVRGAIRALEEVGFLDRAIPGKGSRHRLTGAGELHRKPILFQFGRDYASSFSRANQRAQKARERHSGARRAL